MKSSCKAHIDSFTIMNVLIGMTLAGLLVGFIYSIQTNMSQMTHNYSTIHLVLNDYEIAKADIKRNIEKAKEIQSYPKGFSVVTQNNEIITYYVDDLSLIRKNGSSKSTLFENVKNIDLSIKTSEVDELEEIVTSVSVTFLVEKQELIVHVYKSFDSKNKLNTLLISES